MTLPTPDFTSLPLRTGNSKKAVAGLFAISLTALAFAVALPYPAAGQSSGADIRWESSVIAAESARSPIARKLAIWISATSETTLSVPLADLMRFVRDNPDWPRLGSIRQRIERDIGGQKSENIIGWFRDYPPETTEGITAYVASLQAAGHNPEASEALKSFWRKGTLDRAAQKKLVDSFPGILSAADHNARADMLAWEERYDEAEQLLPLLSQSRAALLRAKIALGLQQSTVETALMQVPAQLQNDEGLLFERLRWRRKRQQNDGAYDILRQMPPTIERPDKWWKEINILARRALEEKRYAAAYDIAAADKSTSGADYAQAQFLRGWLALRFMGKPVIAFQHFNKMFANVESAVSRSRAAYWAGRAASTAGKEDIAKLWHQTAAQYISTYYGQLSYATVYGVPDGKQMRDPAVDAASAAQFDKKDMVRVIRLLDRLRLNNYSDPFFAKLIDTSKTAADLSLVARLALETGQKKYAVQANKEAQQKLGVYLFDNGYPLLSSVPRNRPEGALVHAIVYRESMFDRNATSTAGALGMMQLMPGTAKATARKAGLPYSAVKLTADPIYNVTLGSDYLADMIDNYGGFYPLAIAAYNAGPGNVRKWLDDIGDPRAGKLDIIDWVEMIPIYETRNYVQRVMETFYIYRLKQGQKPLTIVDITKNR